MALAWAQVHRPATDNPFAMTPFQRFSVLLAILATVVGAVAIYMGCGGQPLLELTPKGFALKSFLTTKNTLGRNAAISTHALEEGPNRCAFDFVIVVRKKS